MKITTINALFEALNAGAPVNRVLISEKRRDGRIAAVTALCRDKGIPFMTVPAAALERKAGRDNQGIFAEVSPVSFLSIDEIISPKKNGMILIIDSVTDAGNLGAVIRTGVAAGVDGFILSRRNTAPVNDTVLKASSGALMKARIAVSGNLSNDIGTLKDKGYWIISTHVTFGIPYYEYAFDAPTAVVIGSEGKGISPIVKKHTDQFITIPHSADIDSLNVSAAAAVILFEALRQRVLIEGKT